METALYYPVPVGAWKRETGFGFTVWAPQARSVELELPEKNSLLPMAGGRDGYWRIHVPDTAQGTRYAFRVDSGESRPDPASQFQPEGVHTPSEVVDHDAFAWTDQGFVPVPYSELILYELHIGTFTLDGTFDSAASWLDYLLDLGINGVEVMPVCQFPGTRNWGYDGVHPFAVQNSYGGPQGFKRFVDACHHRGISVILDVVYNHLGPEGNYLREFGPYFTDRYKTPWGEAVNFDGPDSDGVRNYFLQNALYWFDQFHVDGLRLDATHAIFDKTPQTFLHQLTRAARRFAEKSGRKRYIIAESNLNDPSLVSSPSVGGDGMDGVWSDDFHHVVHTLLTGENLGYYMDYGSPNQLAHVLENGFLFQGEYSPFRKRFHGAPGYHLPGESFVVSIQNHDQVGNRMNGERIASLVDTEAQKTAAGLLLLSPFLPMLFMGEEFGETNPFLYFVSHLDPSLVEAVRTGRKQEFEDFKWESEPPDPQSEETFARSRIDWEKKDTSPYQEHLAFYRNLISLRKSFVTPLISARKSVRVSRFGKKTIGLTYLGQKPLFCLFHVSPENAAFHGADLLPEGTWTKLLDSSESHWGGPGPGLPRTLPGEFSLPTYCVCVYGRENSS